MNLSPESITLIRAGQDRGALSLHGQLHAELQTAAERQAAYEARLGRQTGHAEWPRRQEELRRNLPHYRLAEVTAESWTWDHDPAAAAASIYESWRQSPGHWAHVNGPADLFGYAMARGEHKYFACGILGVQQ